MGVRTTARAWACSKQSGTLLLMQLAVADYADDATGEAYPSVTTLAQKTKMSPRNARYLLEQLEAAGELVIVPGAGRSGTNLYRIALVEGVKPIAWGVQPAAGVKPASGGVQPIAPNPSLNHQEPSSLARKRAKRASPNAEHPLFPKFYDAYPRKVARPEAAKAFAKVAPTEDELGVMLAAIEAQGLAQRCADGEAQFVPHPATWLNKERWKDSPTPPPAPRQQQARGGFLPDDGHVFTGIDFRRTKAPA